MWNETGARNITARFVWLRIAIGHEIVVHCIEETAMLPSYAEYLDYPLQPIARRRAKKEFCLKARVIEQFLMQQRNVGHMVEVDTKQIGLLQQAVPVSSMKDTRECAEVKVLSFVLPCLVFARNGAQHLCLLLCIRANDVAVNVRNADAAQWLRVADGFSEKGKRQQFSLFNSEKLLIDRKVVIQGCVSPPFCLWDYWLHTHMLHRKCH